MIKRTFHFSFKLFFEIVAALITGVLILLGGFIYKISKEPIRLNFLTPYVQDTVRNVYPNLNFNTNDGLLSFENGGFKVVFEKVFLSDSASASLIDIDSLNLSFSFQSLMQQVPAKIEAKSASMIVNIDEDGRFSLKFGNKKEKTVESNPIPMSERITLALANKKVSALEEISFTNSNLVITNEIADETWDLEKVNILFKKDRAGNVVGSAKLNINDYTISWGTTYDIKTLKTDMVLGFDEVNLNDFADRHAVLKDMNVVLTGNVYVGIDKDLKIDVVELDGAVSEGSNFLLEEYFDYTVPVSGAFDFIYDDNVITTKELSLNVGGIETTSDVSANFLEETVSITYKLDTKGFPVDKAEKYWPKEVAGNAKQWIVKRLKNGEVDATTLTMQSTFVKADKDLLIDELGGYIDFSKMTVDYLDTMPNVEGVSGRALFDKDLFDIELYSGNIGDVLVEKGSKINIPLENTVVTVDVDLNGSLQTVAEIINNKPLGYMDRISILPSEVGGQVKGNLKLYIPISGEDIQVEASTELEKASIKNLVLGQDLISGSGSLKVNNDKLEIDAFGVFNNAEVQVNWDEFFADDADYDRVAEIDGNVDINLLKDLDVIDLTDSIKNGVMIDALYKSKNGKGSVFAKSKLVGTDINLYPIPYKKTVDEEADFEMLIKLENDTFKELENIKLIDDEIELRGWFNNGVLYLSDLLMPEKNIEISGYYENEEGKVPNIDISGVIGAPASLKIMPKDGVNTIDLQVDDLGAAMKSLDIFEKLFGGRLSLQGQSSEDLSILNGRLVMEDFRVVNMDALTSMLGAMSLDGLSQALSGEGIVFEKLAADFTWDYNKNQFIFKDGKTSGSSLGLTFDNIWDTENNTIAMKGTIAPLQGMSRAIGSIPIIGTVLTGANQDGIFGAKYVIKGKLSSPEVSVNPASTLTPGLLRDIFFSGENLEKTIKKENEKKAQEELEKDIPKDLDEIRGVQ